MIKTCPYCREEFDTEEHSFKKSWCCQDCFLADLDMHLEKQWEERKERKLSEDDWREDR